MDNPTPACKLGLMVERRPSSMVELDPGVVPSRNEELIRGDDFHNVER